MSTNNICFLGEVRKLSILLNWKKHLTKSYVYYLFWSPCHFIISCNFFLASNTRDSCLRISSSDTINCWNMKVKWLLLLMIKVRHTGYIPMPYTLPADVPKNGWMIWCSYLSYNGQIRGWVNKQPAYPISDRPRLSRFSCFVSIYILYMGTKLHTYRVILKILNVKHG